LSHNSIRSISIKVQIYSEILLEGNDDAQETTTGQN